MAPIQFLLTSALMLSAAIAAPISTHGVLGRTNTTNSTTPIAHHGEPMRKASSPISGLPSMTFNTQAMESSAIATAAQAPSSNQNNGIFNVLNTLSSRYDTKMMRRQLDALTEFLTGLNKIGKRSHEEKEEEKIESRQLGLLKSAPAALGQLSQVPNLLESLPIKRSGDGILSGLGGLGGIMGGSVKKRDTVTTEESADHKPTYTEKALKGFQGLFDHSAKGKDEDQKQQPSAADSIGLNQIIKRGTNTDPVTSILTGILAKRGDMELDDDTLNELAKRADLTNGDDDTLDESHSKRQLSLVSSLATGMLSNAGSAASDIGKLATGSIRRSDDGADDAGLITEVATAGLGKTKQEKTGDDDEGDGDDDDFTGVSDLADELADGAEGEDGDNEEQPDQSSNEGPARKPLTKRQVPPIAGDDLLSIVKGMVANPNIALSPVTKGILVGGKTLSDLAPAQ